ncbi:unnamed protein product [Candidula unifasciata]|uniref:SH3 domain-containing protein n=1 Tax=Candidula unifasciata TaxID=100452 RepID=A0A8S3Z1I4_9EUPU|nr:unnamed protein product [Candidula unifasciata]
MARTEVQRCLDWLFQQQQELESASFGRGKLSVLEALAIQHSKVKDIVKSEKLDSKSVNELNGIYDSVKALSDQRKSCLEVINQIASLEDHIQNLSAEIDARSVSLVSTSDVTKNKGGYSQANESFAKTSQGCISSVRQNWRYIFQLAQCSEVHLRNAAAYQEFFQEAEEAEYWMNATLPGIHQSIDRSKISGSRSDVESFLQETTDTLAAYLKWQTKIDYLFDKARQVVPVPLRVKSIPSPRPVIALTNFKTSEIEFIEGETLTLLDNSDKKKWKTETGQIGFVPAVIILITGPSTDAFDIAVRLRLQLLALWTSSVKYLGCYLIALMLLIFRDWTEEEAKLLQAMEDSDKQELLRILLFIEESLSKTWSDYDDFKELQERIARLRKILGAASGKDSGSGNSLSTSLITQVKLLESLLIKYKDFWAFWEAFKCIAEMLKQPKFLLVCDKWDQLKFVTSAHFVKFWDTQLDLEQNKITKSDASLVLQEAANEDLVNSEVTIEEKTEETTTDTVTSTLEEEQHTFIIKGVLDPRDNSTQLTLEQAVSLGIVDETHKLYVNPKTGKAMSMSDAMNEGRVLVEFVSRKKIREEKNSYGLITITITKETKPFTIIGVIDPVTDERLTVSQATAKNILNINNSTFRTESGELITIADAIHSALVLVEYQDGDQKPEVITKANAVHGDQKPEVITKTYAVHGVVDQKKKQKVSFADALRDGLLERDSGEYVNNITGEHVAVHEAILRGFIKARVVSDPSKLDINPENSIVVEKLSSAKTKLLKSVKAIKAFKEDEG